MTQGQHLTGKLLGRGPCQQGLCWDPGGPRRQPDDCTRSPHVLVNSFMDPTIQVDLATSSVVWQSLQHILHGKPSCDSMVIETRTALALLKHAYIPVFELERLSRSL